MRPQTQPPKIGTLNINITLNTDNAAFQENQNELRDILMEWVDGATGEFTPTSGILRDSNGNTVGSVKVIGK